MNYNEEREKWMKELIERDISDKENACRELKKVFAYTDCGVVDIKYIYRTETVEVTFEGGDKQVANVAYDSTAAMLIDIFKQIEFLR